MPAEPLAAIVSRLRASGSVFAEDEAQLLSAEARTPDELAAMVRRRLEGQPLEQILGWAEFCGLRVAVDPGVFVPRRRTGLMVREAVRLTHPRAVVVDMCCGSGAVGAAVAAAADDIELHAADLDSAAVACAHRNVAAAGGRVHQGDLFEALPEALRGHIDVLVANVPYVPTEEIATMPPEARLHEPAVALDGGADGLVIARRVAVEAPSWLAPGGTLLVEVSEAQASGAVEAFAGVGLVPTVVRSDEYDGTVVMGSAR